MSDAQKTFVLIALGVIAILSIWGLDDVAREANQEAPQQSLLVYTLPDCAACIADHDALQAIQQSGKVHVIHVSKGHYDLRHKFDLRYAPTYVLVSNTDRSTEHWRVLWRVREATEAAKLLGVDLP